MFPATVTRTVLLLTVLCWAVQPTLSRSAALFEASESRASEMAKEVDWEKLDVACLSISAAEISVELLSAHVAETLTLPSEVDVCCLGHLRGPPQA